MEGRGLLKEEQGVEVPSPEETPEAAVQTDGDQGEMTAVENPSSAAASSSKKDSFVVQASWFRQLQCATLKNFKIMIRHPIIVSLMTVSSILSVLLTVLVARDDPDMEDFGKVPLTSCGTVELRYLRDMEYEDRSKVPASYNDSWRSGTAVLLLSMGPMLHAVCVFLLLQIDIQTQMWGVLRNMGLYESVFWASWWVPFLITSLLNSIFATITMQAIVSVHAFTTIYAGGQFASMLFLNLALTAASMFLSAVCGTTKSGASVWLIILMLAGPWIFFGILAPGMNTIPYDASSATSEWNNNYSPSGIFWLNLNTSTTTSVWDPENQTYIETTCENPILDGEGRGNVFGTEEERNNFPENEWFVGCHFNAGYHTQIWNGEPVTMPFAYMFPYFHFLGAWSNFVGYTSMPNRKFSSEHGSMSPEELALDSIPGPLDDDAGRGGTLFPQGSTFMAHIPSMPYTTERVCDEWSCWTQYRYLYNCPLSNATDYFCPYLNSCKTTKSPAPTEDSPSSNNLYGHMFLQAVLYTLLAMYWAQVFPKQNGSSRPFYFFLLPSYWFPPKIEATDASLGVELKDVWKKFGSFEAVKGVSLRMEPGQITALLGHNGAGKSTCSNIIGCEFLATSGEVSVFGQSVNSNPFGVRNLVGVCRQDDYLYSDLTAKEHLELYGGLRGVAAAELPEIVRKWLESVDLEGEKDHFPPSFSGGMKRRLSLACSTIGNRPLIILDEPTTGMDPVNRRFVWRHIDSIKPGKCVLLTTHAMEEADLLADSVAIMKKGELAAFGSPLELKSAHGSALQFNILTDKTDVEDTKAAILKHFNGYENFVQVDAGESGNISATITAVKNDAAKEGVAVDVLASFVSWLEDEDSSKVSEYGFSNSSLEEVFLKVTAGDDEEADDDDGIDVCCPNCSERCIARCLAGPCRCCCRPRRRLSTTEMDGDVENTEEATPSDSENHLDAANISTFKPTLNPFDQLKALLHFHLRRAWLTKASSKGNWIYLAICAIVLPIMSRSGADSSGSPGLFILGPVVLCSFFLLNLVSPVIMDRNDSLFYLMRTQGLMKNPYWISHSVHSFSSTFFFCMIAVSLFCSSALYRPIEFCTYDMDRSFCKLGWFDQRRPYPESISWWNDVYEGEPVTLYATWEGSGYGKVFGAIIAFAISMSGAINVAAYAPGVKFAIMIIVFIILVLSVVPALLFLEHFNEEQVEECDDYGNCIWRTPCERDICSTFNYTDFTRESIGLLGEEFLNCVGSDTVGGSIAGLCISPSESMLPQLALFNLLYATLFGTIRFESEPDAYLEAVLIPSIGGDGVSCDGTSCTFPYAHKSYIKSFGFSILGSVLLLALGFFFVSIFDFPDGSILVLRTKILNVWKQAMSFNCSVSKSSGNEKQSTSTGDAPLQEVIDEKELVDSLMNSFLEKGTVASRNPSDVEEGSTGESSKENNSKALPPVLIQDLRKVYPGAGGQPPKVAVESLSLHVRKGQVLGFLGKNGAGKTTALKILAASHPATSGKALIAGFDVSREQLSVFERLGSCPQFDIVWRNQTVQRHLEFFGALKGIPRQHVNETALSIANAVGLGAPEVYARQAGQLSGGMRRRLAIAISLIGAPDVLLLDEPSTGLDPSTRNDIWKLVGSFSTPERAVIITTHMMLEADTLCNRIAIMGHGRLIVVATQQSLKDQFGSGYLLQLNLVESSQKGVDKSLGFVKEHLHPDAVLQVRQAKTLQIALPRELDLTKVFTILYSPEAATEGGINQFLLSQSSLEDVFVALGD